MRIPLSAISNNVFTRQSKDNAYSGVSVSWFMIPFDFVMGSPGINKALSSLHVPDCVDCFRTIRVSWSLASQHLIHRLRRGVNEVHISVED